MAFVVKAIKPQKLSVDAIRLEILNELRKEGRVQVRELKKTTNTWKSKVEFTFAIGLTKNEATVISGPSGGAVQIWQWLEEGTRPHRVPKSGTALMAFHPKYGRKTSPKWMGSRGGGPRGNRVVRRGAWTVKGIKPRKWLPTLSKRRRRPFQRNIIKATNRGAQKMYK